MVTGGFNFLPALLRYRTSTQRSLAPLFGDLLPPMEVLASEGQSDLVDFEPGWSGQLMEHGSGVA